MLTKGGPVSFQSPAAEDEFLDALADIILDDIAAHPEIYDVDPAFFGVRPIDPAPTCARSRRGSR